MIPQPRILLVGDSPDDRASIGASLAYWPNAQLEFADTPQALAHWLATGGFDLLVIDGERAPDSPQVVREFKTRYPTAAVVMLVGPGRESIAAEAIQAGVDNIVPKLAGPMPWLTTAIRSALNKRQEREQQALSDALRDTATALTQSLELDQVLDRILANVGRVVPYDVANIMLHEEGCGRVVRRHAGAGHAGNMPNDDWLQSLLGLRLPVATAPDLRQAAATQRPCLISDTVECAEWVRSPTTEWIRSHMCAPLCVRDQVLGFLNLESVTPGFFGQDAIPRLQAFADQAAVALSNAQLHQTTQRRADEFAALYAIAGELAALHDLGTLLRMTVEHAMTLLGTQAGGLYLYDPERHDLELAVTYGVPITPGARLELGEGMAGRVAQTLEPLVIDDYATWEHRARHLEGVAVSASLQVPIVYHGELIGVLSVHDVGLPHRRFDQADIRLLSLLAIQAASAVHVARLFAAEREQRELAETLRQVGAALATELNSDRVLDRLLEQLDRVVPYDTANIMLLEGGAGGEHSGHVRVVRGRGYAGAAAAALGSALGTPLKGVLGTTTHYPAHSRTTLRHMIETGQPLVIPDVGSDPRWVRRTDSGAGYSGAGYSASDDLQRAYAGAPIHVQGELVGFLNVGSRTAGAFNERHGARLQAFADQAGLALQNARLFSLLALEKEHLELLYRLNRQLSSSLDIAQIAPLALDGVCKILGASQGVIAIRVLGETAAAPGTSDMLRLVALTGHTAAELEALDKRLHLHVGDGLVGWVAAQREIAIISDVRDDPRWMAVAGLDDWVQAALGVPLVNGDDLVGVMGVYSEQSDYFNAEHVKLVQSVAAAVAIALANARLYQAEREQFRRWQASQAQWVQAEKMSALGRLLASIAHEINNPLQAIQGCLTLVQEELEAERALSTANALGTPLKGVLGTTPADRYLRIAEDEIVRLANILKRVREFYRPAGQGWQPTDVRAVLSSVLELTGKQLQHSHVTVELDWGDGAERELVIQANPDHLKQVFLNLIINAIDAMALGTTALYPTPSSPEGGQLRISTALDYLVRTDARVQAVRIEVADNGPGIEPEALPRLFEPFFSARPGGAGLGLSICYSIIEAHQGRIAVTSQPGQGTQFTIWLPAAAPRQSVGEAA